jgi:RNA polymerase sigma factor (sigma-70 family)
MDATAVALDEGLVALAQAGDKDAIAALLAAHAPTMMKIACPFASGGADLDDLLQEARLAFLRAIETYEPAHGSTLRTWAYMPVRCAVRRTCERERRGTRACAGDDDEAWLDRGPAMDDEVIERLDADVVLDRLASLDTLDAEILVLRYVEGLSQREAGGRVGLSHVAVGKRERACLERLRRKSGFQKAGSMT